MQQIFEEIFRVLKEVHRRDQYQRYFPELRDLEVAIKLEFPDANVDSENNTTDKK